MKLRSLRSFGSFRRAAVTLAAILLAGAAYSAVIIINSGPGGVSVGSGQLLKRTKPTAGNVGTLTPGGHGPQQPPAPGTAPVRL